MPWEKNLTKWNAVIETVPFSVESLYTCIYFILMLISILLTVCIKLRILILRVNFVTILSEKTQDINSSSNFVNIYFEKKFWRKKVCFNTKYIYTFIFVLKSKKTKSLKKIKVLEIRKKYSLIHVPLDIYIFFLNLIYRV